MVNQHKAHFPVSVTWTRYYKTDVEFCGAIWEYVNADFTLFQSNVKTLLETNLWMEARPTLTRPTRSIMC